MNKQNVLLNGTDRGETSIILCLYLYLQICQVENMNPSNTFTIANESEQIIMDPTDRRGQMYLRYTGPGQDGRGPRYICEIF